MATDLNALVTRLFLETGSTLGQDQLMDLLRSAVPKFNALASNAFTLTDDLLDREATDDEAEGLVLMAVLLYLDGRAIGESGNAVVVSNVAGKVDLSGVEFALSKRRRELLEQQLTPLLRRLNGQGVVSEVFAGELGETRPVSTMAPQR